MNKKIVTRRSRVTTIKTGEQKYMVWIGYTDRWKFYWGKVYHRYDTYIPSKVPGYHAACGLLRKHLGAEIRVLGLDKQKERLRDRFVGWTVKQDIRCYQIGDMDVEHLGWVEVDKDTYNLLKGA